MVFGHRQKEIDRWNAKGKLKMNEMKTLYAEKPEGKFVAFFCRRFRRGCVLGD